MNFSKLPKEKRNQLVLVALFTAMALGGLGFGLIQWQHDKLRELAEKKEAAQQKLKRMQDAIKRADEIENAGSWPASLRRARSHRTSGSC